MQSTKHNNNRDCERGLTIVEVLVVAPLIVLLLGVFIGYMVGITGDGLRISEKNVLAYNTQSALGQIEADTQNSTSFLSTTGTLINPQGSNDTTSSPATNPFNATASSGPIIISSYGTTKAPVDPSRELVYKNTPDASCAPATLSSNEPYPVIYIYYLKANTVWKRTLIAPVTGSACASTPLWQRPSCSPGYSNAYCKAEDEKILDNVQSLEVQYYATASLTSAAATTSAQIEAAQSMEIKLVSAKQAAGEQLSYPGALRVTRVAAPSVTFAPSTPPPPTTLSYTGSMQTYTVPAGVTSLDIETSGAQGGIGTSTYTGGLGARIKGTFTVTPGQVLKVLVGQKGGDSASYKAGGGGGGTFVTSSSNNPLAIAGGGGGGGGNSNPGNGNPGLTSSNGGSGAVAGGSNGYGGGGSTGSSGGGGLLGNGGTTSSSSGSGAGAGFVNGGAGGAGGTCAAGGGGGGYGGGSGGEWCQQGTTGAGGGYSGGGGGDQYSNGGGGGSFSGGTSPANTSGVQSGNGRAIFTPLNGGGGSGPVAAAPTLTDNFFAISSGSTTPVRMAVKGDSKLYVWGNGQTTPIVAQTGSDWATGSAGEHNRCAIKTSGTLWCWSGTATATQVGSATDWRTVSAGNQNSCGIKTGGTLWCWGQNQYGEIGDGTTTMSSTPKIVGSATDWKEVQSGFFGTCAIKTTGARWCWGFNGYASPGFSGLGNSSTATVTTPTVMSGGLTWNSISYAAISGCGVTTTAALYCWGQAVDPNTNTQDGRLGIGAVSGVQVPTRVGTANDWRSVNMGSIGFGQSGHTCATKTNDSLWCWGQGGRVGNGTSTTALTPVQIAGAWKQVETTGTSTCGVKTDDSIWCWGDGAGGQLGNGSTTAQLAPVAITLN